MNSTDKMIIHHKMRELYGALLTEPFLKDLRNGKKIHMTITLGGPYEIWVEAEGDKYNPITDSVKPKE
jgi:hypothetical protein